MSLRAILPCPDCDGEGKATRFQIVCTACHGSGNLTCEVRNCVAGAVGFSEDGTAMCEDCLGEWISQVEAESGMTKRPKKR